MKTIKKNKSRKKSRTKRGESIEIKSNERRKDEEKGY